MFTKILRMKARIEEMKEKKFRDKFAKAFNEMYKPCIICPDLCICEIACELLTKCEARKNNG